MDNLYIKEFILEDKYSCYGHFYTIQSQKNEIKCRSVLEIIDYSIKPNILNDILDWKPDAIFIMMNPGASKPIEPSLNYVDANCIGDMKIDLVATCPDKTQYQLMRIMEYKKWKHVRVLNLSDIRNPDSNNFYATIEELNSSNSPGLHSCFDNKRVVELKKKLNIHNPIYAAWGVDDFLDPLIELSLSKLDRRTILMGIRKDEDSNKFYHPLLKGKPMSAQVWLEKIVLL
jgi:hypothetical protein